MGRKQSVDEQALIAGLSRVFRDVGYEGASLTALANATGLKKASLYHRFPDGKTQMAQEVLAAAETWLNSHVLAVLRTTAPPAQRIDAMVRQLDAFYDGGRQACLLNMLSSAHMQRGPFTTQIRKIFTLWIDALAAVLVEAGLTPPNAQARAQRALALVQGALVLARGMGTPQPFQDCLKTLPDELLAP